MIQLSHLYTTTGKTATLTIWTIASKVMPLLFNTLSKFVMLPSGSGVKTPLANAGNARDTGLTPGSGRLPGGGNGNPLQCSFLENPREGEAWWAAVYGVAQSWTLQM